MIEELHLQGGYFCNEQEREQLKIIMWPDGIHLNREVIAQPVEKIAELAGIVIPENTTFLMVEGKLVSRNNPFCSEKLSIVLTV